MGVLADIAGNPVLQNIDRGSAAVWLLSTIVVAVALPSLLQLFQKPRYPYINMEKGEFTYKKAKDRFVTSAMELISAGYEKFGGKPFYLVTDYGPKIILPPSYIEAVNNEPALDFKKWTQEELLSYLPGFEVNQGTPGHMFEDAVRIKLTQNLPKFTQKLSDEMTLALDSKWGSSTEWHAVQLKSHVLNFVARLSAIVFVGPSLARNGKWLDISVNFTVDLFQAIQQVKTWPKPLFRVACYVDPLVKKLKREYDTAIEVLRPILKERDDVKTQAVKEGRPEPSYNDAIEWFKQSSKGAKYDPVRTQLGLSVAAVHTTSDLMSQTVYNLCLHPETHETLRQEAVSVLKGSGWAKTALYDLKMLDSFIKETQRVKPIGGAFMNRIALRDVVLPGDVLIKKGESIAISMNRMWDDSIYEDAAKFDPWRFAKRRETPGLEHKSHLVSTSTDMTAFSHGKHACPGRFFAANEVKIALVHMLLKYDMRLAPNSSADYIKYGMSMNSNPFTQIEVRKRQAEIDI